jgi:hypothetical protein
MPRAPEHAPAPFAEMVLLCRKCARRLGPAGKKSRKTLKRALKTTPWGKVRLVETGCFSLCPRRAQVLATLRPRGERRVAVVEPGFDADRVIDYLLKPPR